MIDDDDVTETALLWPEGGGVIGAVVGLLVIGTLAYFACQNKAECADKHCDHGVPRLLDHKCLCVEEVKP